MPRWICAQLGSREHYAVPRTLVAHQQLDSLYTDYWQGSMARAVTGNLNHPLARTLNSRYHPDISDSKVTSWNLTALRQNFELKRAARYPSSSLRYEAYCKIGEDFCRNVVRALKQKVYDRETRVFFGYDTASLEIINYLKNEGIRCYLDQTDPCRTEIELVREESDSWPNWQDFDLEVPDVFYDRHAAEWEAADQVIVNSTFSRRALIEQGVPGQKITVIPLAFTPQVSSQKMRSDPYSRARPLRVLFLGQITLRKGIQYLIQAAGRLLSEPVVFDIVGNPGIREHVLAGAPANMTFHGPVPINATTDWYQESDLFILPTLSDGFAITQLEAMAAGLPVIATENCGEVVTNGEDGQIVPIRDSDAIVEAIQSYLSDPELLRRHADAAVIKSRQFSLDVLYQNLQNLQSQTPEVPAK